ncbi:MAG: hypothetical protein Ta2A_17500 [Treponemataceae bacterium]|nr:MAG: hypothetical protein Ta2A_17500 [Treponemataceae bacterium]
MLYPGVTKLAKARGFKRTKDEAVGIVKNCAVRLSDGSNLKDLILHTPAIDESDSQEITRRCIETYKIKPKDVRFGENLVEIIFREVLAPYSMKKIDAAIDELTAYFAQKYPEAQVRCTGCGTEGAPDIYTNGHDTFLLCASCAAAHQTRQNEERRQWQDAPNNYLAGFFAAALFSLPGMLLSAAIFVFADRVAAICAVAYIFLANKGYHVVRGKVSRTGAFIVNGVGFVMTAVGTALAYAVYLWTIVRQSNESAAFTQQVAVTLEALKNLEILREMGTNAGLALVVASVYIIQNVWRMTKEWSFATHITRAWNFGEKPAQ